MIDELGFVGGVIKGGVDAVFVGGGTPTLLQPDLWSRVGAALNHALQLAEGAEFTVEANPETVNEPLLEALGSAGVNRISIGAQTFDPRHLKTLERWHDPANVGRSVEMVRAAGIENINLDLIFGIPGQSLADWKSDLEAALALRPDHLSCYGLTYEPGTAMTQRLAMGRVERIDADLEASMFAWTLRRLADAGFEQYEISNFAKPGRRCRHNMVYWTAGNWLAVGPGAAGHADGWRWKNAPRLGKYLDSTGPAPVEELAEPDPAAQTAEWLMMGLRLREGVDAAEVERRAGVAPKAAIDRHIDGGLLELCGGRLRLTDRGLMLADSVLVDLI